MARVLRLRELKMIECKLENHIIKYLSFGEGHPNWAGLGYGIVGWV